MRAEVGAKAVQAESAVALEVAALRSRRHETERRARTAVSHCAHEAQVEAGCVAPERRPPTGRCAL